MKPQKHLMNSRQIVSEKEYVRQCALDRIMPMLPTMTANELVELALAIYEVGKEHGARDANDSFRSKLTALLES